MTRCTRCTVLRQPCTPVMGMCTLDHPAYTQAQPETHAAVIQDHRTDRVRISTILIIDFYAGWV
jgi:hypothetical protein